MGLFSILPVQRFLDSADSEHVYSGTKLLVSGFLRAMQAQDVYFKYGMHPLMREHMRGAGTADSQCIGFDGNLLSSIGDDEEMGGGAERIVIESQLAAVETCAIRMSKLRVKPRVSRGISFGIGREPDGPKWRWSVVFHRGPLPLLQIELSDASGFQPPQTWLDSITKSNCAHVMWSANSYLGRGDHLFLMLKRRHLFPYSKGSDAAEAVAAGKRLREMCREVWRKQNGGKEENLQELSSWQWRRRRFVRNFDRALLELAGAEDLNAVLKDMGTRLESWLPACED